MLLRRATHRPEMFNEYIPYEGPEGEGFRISRQEDYQEIYIIDDYGGWVDRELNYYNRDGDPAGYFDKNFNFYEMSGQRVPGGYKGGKMIEKKLREKIKILENYPQKQKFVIEMLNLPKSTTPSQMIQYILERCDITQDQVEECKKVQKDASKGYVVVTGSDIAKKLLILEGRRFRIKEKDGQYTCTEIQIFVRETKINRQQQRQDVQQVQQQEEDNDDKFTIIFEGLDIKKTNQEFQKWLSMAAQCDLDDLQLNRNGNKGSICVENEDVMYRILKQNGRSFGESRLLLKQK